MADVVGTAVVNIVPNTTQFNNALAQLGYQTQAALGGAAASGLAGMQAGLIKAQAGLQVAGNRAQQLGRNMTGLTVVAAAFGVVGVKAAYDFDTSMRKVGAITQTTGEEFDRLSERAEDLGRRTEFTASQVADAMVQLSLAGFSVDETYTSVEKVLRLASAGGVDLAESANITANALRAYNLNADESGRVTDVLTSSFTNANTNLQQFAEAWRYVAPVASTSRLEMEEVAAALGSMADAGFQGSYGGTALRTAIAKMEKPTREGADVLKRLGVETHTADGELRNLTDIVRQFETVGLSTADAITLLGVRAGPGFLALVGGGSAKLEELTKINRRAGDEINIAAEAMQFSTEQLDAMSRAFDFTQPAVQEFGYNLDETSAALALFVQQGLSAEEASMILMSGMRATSNDAILPLVGATRDLNGNLVNSSGEIMSLAEILAVLESGGYTTAESLSALGVDAEAMARLVALSDEEMAKLSTSMFEGGRAAQIAEEQMEGIRGGLLRLKSAIEGVAIDVLGGKDGLINKFGDLADSLANFINRMMDTRPELVRFVIFATLMGGALGIVARIVGFVLRGLSGLLGVFRFLLGPVVSLVGTIGKFAVMLKTTGSFAVTLSAMLNPVGLVIGAIVALGAAIAILYFKWQPFRDFVDTVLDKLVELWDLLNEVGRAIEAELAPAIDRISGPFMTLAEVIGGIYLSPLVGGLETLTRLLSGDTQGALETAKQAFEEFRVKLTELPGAVSGFVDAFFEEVYRLTGVGERVMNEVFDGMREAVIDIPVIGPIVDSVIAQMQSAFTAGTGLTELISGIFTLDPEKIREGLGGIISGFGTFLLVDFPTGLLEFVADVGAALGVLFEAAATWLGDNMGTIMETARELPKKVFDFVAGLFSDDTSENSPANAAIASTSEEDNPLIQLIQRMIDSAGSWIETTAQPKFEEAIGSMGDVDWGGVVSSWWDAWSGVLFTFYGTIYSAAFGLIEQFALGVWNGVQTFVGNIATIGQYIWEGFLNGLNWIATQGDYLINLFLDYVWYPFLSWLGIESPSTKAMEVGVNLIMGLLIGMQNTISMVWNWLITVPGTIISLLGNLGSILVGWFTTAWNWLAVNAPLAVSGLFAWISGVPGMLITTLGDFGGRIFGWLKSGFDTIVTRGGEIIAGALEFVRGIPGKISGALTGAAGAFGGLVGKIVGLWPFAEGGIVSVPTPALIGEAGPEVVIPLTDPDRAKQLVMQSGLMGLIANEPTGGIAAGGAGFTVSPPSGEVGEVPKASESVTTAMEQIATSALDALQPVADWFVNAGTEAAAAMTLFGQQVWAATQPSMLFFQSQFQLIFTGLGVFITTWMTSIKAAFASLPAYFSGISQQITAALGSPFRSFASGVWNPFATAMNAALRQIPGVSGISIPMLPTAHAGGVIGDGLPYTGGPLGNDEMVVKMQRGEGVIPASVMRDMTPGEFEAIRRGGGLVEAPPQSDAYVRVPGTGQPYGPTVVSPVTSAGFVDPSVMSTLKAAINVLRGPAAAMSGQGFMGGFLGGLALRTFDASLNLIETKINEANARAATSIGAGDVFPGGIPQALGPILAEMAAMRGRSGSYLTLLKYIRATGVPHVVTSTIRPGAVARGSGRASLHSMARAIDLAGPSGGRDTPELLRIYQAFAPARNLLSEIIYSGPGGNYAGRGGITAADHHDHVHVGLANGAVVTRRMSAILGEAGPEVVLPLTRPMRALQLAQESGLFSVLAEAQESQRRTLVGAGAPSGTGTMGAPTDGGLFPGSGNTYNIYGVGMEQVIAEIQAREAASARVRTTRR